MHSGRIGPFGLVGLGFGLAIGLAAGQPARAALNLVTLTDVGPSSIVDVNFENVGGFLATTYGLGKSDPACVSNCTVLPAIERAVGQMGGNGANGLFLPNASTGFPPTQALTNYSVAVSPTGTTYSGTSPVSNSVAVPFSYKRTGQVVTYTLGSGGTQTTWTSDSRSYFSNIDALELRVRAPNADGTNYTSTTLTISNLVFSDMTVTGQSLGAVSAGSGNVRIALWNGAVGDFTLSGTYTLAWTGLAAMPGGWNTQVKGLDLPAAVATPEPGTLALLGVGLAGLTAGRRRRG